jgi:hypothetical protein
MSPASSDASILAVGSPAPLRPTVLAVASCTRQHANLLVPGQIVSDLVLVFGVALRQVLHVDMIAYHAFMYSSKLDQYSVKGYPRNHFANQKPACMHNDKLNVSCFVPLHDKLNLISNEDSTII